MKVRLQNLSGLNGHSHPLRRRNVRIPCSVLARVEAGEETLRGLCTDLSLGGMLFLGPAVAVGERINVTLDLSDSGRVRLNGEVLGHRTLPVGGGMAIRFPGLTQRDLKAINRFVAFQLS
jgi:hypothetical protein